jgi:hypothetical protein
MTIALKRQTVTLLQKLTSLDTAVLGAGVWLSGAAINVVRAPGSSGYLLQSSASTAKLIDIPFSVDDKVGFIVSWACTESTATTGLVLRIHAGDKWQKGLGDVDLPLFAEGTVGTDPSSYATEGCLRRWMIGPLESARFVRAATSTFLGCEEGDPAVRFSLTTDVAATLMAAAPTSLERHKVHIQPFSMPSVEYAT